MSRVARIIKSRLVIIVAVIVVIGVSIAIVNTAKKSDDIKTVSNSQHQTVEVSYKGKNGVKALDLLKQKTQVKTKHYSFGDMVLSINGTEGNGPKYWTFYLNGKMASVGAGAYTTKDSDNIQWKLQ